MTTWEIGWWYERLSACPHCPLQASEPVYVEILRSPGSIPSLTESIPLNRVLGSINVYKYGLWTVFKTDVNGFPSTSDSCFMASDSKRE
jgi:hypothetical protein